MQRTRLKRRAGKKTTRLPTITKPVYFYQWKEKYGRSPIGFIGRLDHFPPIEKQKNSETVIIDWKTKVVRDIWGRPIGKLPSKMRFDKYCPDTFEVAK